MLKIVFYVLGLMTMVACRFAGDSCVAEGQMGTCTELSLCSAVYDETRPAGSPMPHHIAFKLQQLICGYNDFGPLICCVESSAETGWPDNKNPSNNNGDIYNRPVWGGIEDKHGSVIDSGEDKQTNTPVASMIKIAESERNNSRNKRLDLTTNNGPPDVTGHRNLAKLPNDCGNMDGYKISGGNRTALYEMPWMVLFYYNTTRDIQLNLNCAGTLINEWYVLTAAHCVASGMHLDHLILGEWDVRTDPDCDTPEGASPQDQEESCAPKKRDVGIDKVIPHPEYTVNKFVNDIALIRLAEPADFTLNTTAPICLPVTHELQNEELVDKNGIVAGWGKTEFGLQSPVLLSVALPITSNPDCHQAYRCSPRIYDSQLCASGNSGKENCVGDSGGPLLYPGRVGAGIRQVQRGIVSYGSSQCGVGPPIPGVYTRVAYYMDWILNNIS